MKYLLLSLVISLSTGLSVSGGTAVPDHSTWNSLLQKYVSEAGVVNYSAFKTNKEFQNYILTISGSHPDDSWSRDQKMAYWINAYNAFTVKLIIDNMPLRSIKDI
ncbi:MAG: DUF547 domain-containing protein, partial [Flavobacteriales bacterium]|nr:DUF547 domain-containing protein [Flavobacteriales bacterium]